MFVTIGFGFVAMNIWGYHHQEFSNFGNSVLSLLLITIGAFDNSTMLQEELRLTLTFMFFFYFFIYQFMFGIISIIYIDSYRLIIIDQGIVKEDSWTGMDWVLWFFSWVPNKYTKRCNKALESITNWLTTIPYITNWLTIPYLFWNN